LKIGICCHPTFGGSGAVATELGMALAHRGHEVHFLSYARPARLAEFHPLVTFHRARVSSYPLFRYPPYDLALAALMREVAASHDLDVLHVHYAIPHAVSAALARDMLGSARPRIVTTLHGTDITIVGSDPGYMHPTRYGLRRSDAVTAVSDWLRAETVRVFGPEAEIEVIPNFVDTERFAPGRVSECRSAFAAAGAKVLCHVSNFRPVKRVGDTVRILAGVAGRVDARLLLVGDGPERARVEELARELGVSERVNFLGEQTAIERVLTASDLFLLPSEHESFGLAALEAMACGVPVLGTRAGGLQEVVRDGVTGSLFPVGDVETATERALEILTDDGRGKSMGAAARTDALERFSSAEVVSRYLALYERVLSEPAR